MTSSLADVVETKNNRCFCVQVTCGSMIKLESPVTKHRLHSFDVNYGTGSGQQAVVGSSEHNSGQSMWLIRSGRAEGCTRGETIKIGTPIRLQHAGTGKWLHSHLFPSPLTGGNHQEVSGFGSSEQSDTGDVWLVEWDDAKQKHWMRDMPIRIKHKDTGAYLSNHGKTYPRPIAGHSEIFAVKNKKGKEQTFSAIEGVYYGTT